MVFGKTNDIKKLKQTIENQARQIEELKKENAELKALVYSSLEKKTDLIVDEWFNGGKNG